MQVKEISSGASARELREKIVEVARRREIDVVLVWRLDRWGRSVTDLLATLQELDHLGVGFVSLTEALDLTTPAGRAVAGVLAVFADNAERGIMQSDSAEVALWPACQWSGTPHNIGATATNQRPAIDPVFGRRFGSGPVPSSRPDRSQRPGGGQIRSHCR
jgi:hypothetical protein